MNGWHSVDLFLKSYRLWKREEGNLLARFPDIRPEQKEGTWTKLMSFLDCRTDRSSSKGYVFMVRTDLRPSPVYRVKDADFLNVETIEDPVSLIDKHIAEKISGEH